MKASSRKVFNLSYIQLLSYGVHVGHSFANMHLYSAWLVYTYTQNVLLINLFKSLFLARVGFLAVGVACVAYSPIWFVNLDQAIALYGRHFANVCGEVGWVGKWVNGMISNYGVLNSTFRHVQSHIRGASKGRQKWVFDNLNYWLMTRFSWPRAVFTSSVHSTQAPVREAFYLGIPCFGVVDTNTYCNTVSIPFPGNDDSLDALVFYNDIVTNFILLKKLRLIIFWFYNIRRSDRVISFSDWLGSKLVDLVRVNKAKAFSYENLVRTNPMSYFNLGVVLSLAENKHFPSPQWEAYTVGDISNFDVDFVYKKLCFNKTFLNRILAVINIRRGYDYLAKPRNSVFNKRFAVKCWLREFFKKRFLRNRYLRYSKGKFNIRFTKYIVLSRYSKFKWLSRFKLNNTNSLKQSFFTLVVSFLAGNVYAFGNSEFFHQKQSRHKRMPSLVNVIRPKKTVKSRPLRELLRARFLISPHQALELLRVKWTDTFTESLESQKYYRRMWLKEVWAIIFPQPVQYLLPKVFQDSCTPKRRRFRIWRRKRFFSKLQRVRFLRQLKIKRRRLNRFRRSFRSDRILRYKYRNSSAVRLIVFNMFINYGLSRFSGWYERDKTCMELGFINSKFINILKRESTNISRVLFNFNKKVRFVKNLNIIKGMFFDVFKFFYFLNPKFSLDLGVGENNLLAFEGVKRMYLDSKKTHDRKGEITLSLKENNYGCCIKPGGCYVLLWCFCININSNVYNRYVSKIKYKWS